MSEFNFKRGNEALLYFHPPGMELWLLYYLFPFSVTSERLWLGPDALMSAINIHLSKSSHKKSDLIDCEDHGMKEWISCLKSRFEMEFESQLSCKISYFHYLNLTNLDFCQEKDDPKKVYVQAAKIVWSAWNDSSCKKPCNSEEFKTYKTSIPKNTGFLTVDDTEYAKIFIYYDSLLVHENVEYFVYGEDKLVSAVGGVMGLILGYSFLSILNYVIICLRQKCE